MDKSQETTTLPSRHVIDARTECDANEVVDIKPLDQTTGEELTPEDLARTVLALRGLDGK